MKYSRQQHNSGFTLIELMVSTSIFIIVMLVVIGSLVISSNTAKQSQALAQAMDNVNFAVDTMSRSLRIGSHYACITPGESVNLDPSVAIQPADCAPGGNTYGDKVEFMSASSSAPSVASVPTVYELYPDIPGSPSTLRRCTAATGCVDLVASNVDVQVLKFFVKGSDPNDGMQPSVYILMKGVVTVKNVPTSFAIQTIASQRSSE
jgi:type II secretory pathway pseudopilin PulG